MAALEVARGQKVPVSIKLEFSGTVRNHIVYIENQFIPTVNNARNDFEIILDGDPIEITARFKGVPGSEIKKFEVIINKKTGYKISDLKFKYEEIRINIPVQYSKFDLIDTP